MKVAYDAPRRQSVETKNGFITKLWVRSALYAYRRDVLQWPKPDGLPRGQDMKEEKPATIDI